MRFIQGILALIAFAAYIVYQVMVKRKPLSSIKNDVIAIVFFGAVWAGIYYWMNH